MSSGNMAHSWGTWEHSHLFLGCSLCSRERGRVEDLDIVDEWVNNDVAVTSGEKKKSSTDGWKMSWGFGIAYDGTNGGKQASMG